MKRNVTFAAGAVGIGAVVAIAVAAAILPSDASPIPPTSPVAASAPTAAGDPQAIVEDLTADRTAFGMRVNGAYVAWDGTVVLEVDEVTPAGKQAVAARYGDLVTVKAGVPIQEMPAS